MDNLRNLILDLTKNNIAKKKQLLETSEDPRNQERIKDLEQIDSLDVDPSILHEMQDPRLDKYKQMRNEQDHDMDFGFPKLNRMIGSKKIDRFIKDKANLIGNPEDYDKQSVPNKEGSEYTKHMGFEPMESFNDETDSRATLLQDPDIGTWSEGDVNRLKRNILRKLQGK